MAKPLSPLHEAFGRAVRQLRDEKGYTQEALGHKTGLHRNYIGGIERGEQNLTLASISRLAKGFGCSGSELLALAEGLLPRRRGSRH